MKWLEEEGQYVDQDSPEFKDFCLWVQKIKNIKMTRCGAHLILDFRNWFVYTKTAKVMTSKKYLLTLSKWNNTFGLYESGVMIMG